jgi:capsular polysaccharide biosynthesis protein
MKPIVLLALETVLSMCLDHCKSSLMVTPKYLALSTVWDPHSSAETHELEQVQRRAARFVHNNYTERTPGCVTHMVQNLG